MNQVKKHFTSLREKDQKKVKIVEKDEESQSLFKEIEGKLNYIASYEEPIQREGNYKEIKKVSVTETNERRTKISYYGALCQTDLRYYVKTVHESDL